MSDRLALWVLRADALLDFGLGVLLFVAPWTELDAFLDLPQPRPELFTQIAGALLIGFAYLLWEAPNHDVLTRLVAQGAAVANALSAIVILVWVLFGNLGIGTLGTLLLVAIALALAVLAAFEARYFRAGEGA